jgi:hypothetical protein
MTSDHLEEGLARLARREQLSRRLGGNASGDAPSGDAPSGGAPSGGAPSGGAPPATPPSWPLDATAEPATPGDVSAVDEVAAAVGRVVERHPGASVTLTVEDVDGTWLVQVGWRDGSVRTSTAAAPAEPAAPAAARLAELLRADPYLLERE